MTAGALHRTKINAQFALGNSSLHEEHNEDDQPNAKQQRKDDKNDQHCAIIVSCRRVRSEAVELDPGLR